MPFKTQPSRLHTILVADDQPENLALLDELFGRQDASLMFAFNGKQTIDMAHDYPPDLILLDVMMHDMDGFEVCKRLKNDTDTADIPVIFVTAQSEADKVIQGFDVGAVDYITKPYNIVELSTRVALHLKLKHAQDTIKQQKDELQKLNESKDKLFTIIAHDLKNPFNSLLGFARILVERGDSMEPERVQYIHNILLKSAENGYALLESLLQWARMQSGQIKYSPQKNQLYDITNSVVQLLDTMAYKKHITIYNNIPKDICVFADTQMLSTVLRNLISNAVKFTDHHGYVSVDCQVYSLSQKPYIQVNIADNGVGISSDRLPSLFDISNYKSTQGTEYESGTGMGLVLCRDFIALHGGHIWAESVPQRGSTFHFTIPLTKCNTDET